MTTLILPTRDYHTLSVAERYRVIEAAQRVFGRTLPSALRVIRELRRRDLRENALHGEITDVFAATAARAVAG